MNRRHEDFQSSALPTELPAHIKESNYLRDCLSRLPCHVCTMWESRGRVFIDERWRRSKYHFLNIVFAGGVVTLKDRNGLVVSDYHNTLIVPSLTDLAYYGSTANRIRVSLQGAGGDETIPVSDKDCFATLAMTDLQCSRMKLKNYFVSLLHLCHSLDSC